MSTTEENNYRKATNNNDADDADDDDDEESIAVILAPNESPERRAFAASASNTDNDLVAKCEYIDVSDTTEYYRSVVKNHIKHNKSYASLFVMALGATEYDKMLEKSPFAETKKRKYTKHFRPSNQMMMFEVKRRAHFMSKYSYVDEDEGNPFLKNGKNCFTEARSMVS